MVQGELIGQGLGRDRWATFPACQPGYCHIQHLHLLERSRELPAPDIGWQAGWNFSVWSWGPSSRGGWRRYYKGSGSPCIGPAVADSCPMALCNGASLAKRAVVSIPRPEADSLLPFNCTLGKVASFVCSQTCRLWARLATPGADSTTP